MKPRQTYTKASKYTWGFIDWIISVAKEIWHQVCISFIDFWKMYVRFWGDIQSGNWSKRAASIIAILLCSWYLIYLPFSSICHWLSWKYRDWSISYSEYSIPLKNDVEKEVSIFAQNYSNAYWANCDWFKKHDVDIAMWQKYWRLYRSSYECAGFSPHHRVLLHPIYISAPQRSDNIVTLEVNFARVDYDENQANKYTTVRTTLWRLADEKETWRINKMDNIQKWQLNN